MPQFYYHHRSGAVLGFIRKSLMAYKLEVSGQAPLAAQYAGFSAKKLSG